MKILELFSGTECLSNAFRAAGHKCFTVDWDKKFPSDLHCDIEHLTASEIIKKFGVPDVVWAAPDCATYSLAAISVHRTKNYATGNLDPITDYAKKCDRTIKNVIKIIHDLQAKNKNLIYFIENPRAGLQKMVFMKPFRSFKRTITFCKYQTNLPIKRRRMKPTNIWTNHPAPGFFPPCKYGDNCHQKTPRGSKKGTEGLKNAEERAEYPKNLCLHIVKICEDYQKKR